VVWYVMRQQQVARHNDLDNARYPVEKDGWFATSMPTTASIPLRLVRECCSDPFHSCRQAIPWAVDGGIWVDWIPRWLYARSTEVLWAFDR